jgi:hypothetical protein
MCACWCARAGGRTRAAELFGAGSGVYCGRVMGGVDVTVIAWFAMLALLSATDASEISAPALVAAADEPALPS